MENLRLRISEKASDRLQDQVKWYIENAGYSFAKTMLDEFWNDVDRLCLMPTIDRKTDIPSKHEIRVFVSNKKCLIKYWFNTRSLYIVDIVFTDTHSPRFFR
jgi:plasmid stabilization system protein ParE